MKITVLADVHGNIFALRAVLSALKDRVDTILFLGDLAGYYPFVNDCVALWETKKIIGIRGNHDEILIDCIKNEKPPNRSYCQRYGSALTRSWQSLSKESKLLVQSWPLQRQLVLASTTISMFHGSPWKPLEGRIYPDFTDWGRFDDCPADIILLGHTHYPLTKRWKGKLILNPGSVGQPRDSSEGACYAELDLASGEITHYRVAYDKSDLITDAYLHNPNIPYLIEVLTR